jgi:hypothetical protein
MRGMAVFAVVFLFCWTLTTHGKYSVSGDEPHYLMIAESLRTDHDLDLANNYSQNDGRLFGHDNLAVERHAARSLNGELRSVHGVGLAAFVLPAYITANHLANVVSDGQLRRFRMGRGLFVYSIVSLFLMAMTAFGVALVAAGLANISNRRDATIVAIAMGLSPPILSHSFLVFPEVVALFVTCCLVWFTCKAASETDLRHLWWLAIAIGALPWFHQKYIPYSIGLLIVLCWRRSALVRALPARTRWLLALTFAAPQVLAVLWLYGEWGSPAGALIDGGDGTGTIPLTAGVFAHGAVGLLFDRQSGLLAYAPLFWLVPACVVLTWRNTRDLLVPALMLYLPAAAFVAWWAGFSPAARYLTPAVPLFAIPVALALSHRIVRRAAVVLLVWQGLFTALLWQNPRWLWPAAGENQLLEALSVPGTLYSSVLAPIRQSGFTALALLSVGIAIGFSLLIVRLAAKPAD